MSNKTTPITGGCLCGAVRYEADEPPSWVAYCHCRMCQKARGHPHTVVAGFMGAKKAALRFIKGAPKYYKSSAWLERAFCSECGSPLGGRNAAGLTVTVGTLDHPEEWPPDDCHTGIESRIPWDIIHDDLPQWRTEDDPDYIAMKEAAERGEN
jgi:hypothetical protein